MSVRRLRWTRILDVEDLVPGDVNEKEAGLRLRRSVSLSSRVMEKDKKRIVKGLFWKGFVKRFCNCIGDMGLWMS